MYRCCSCHVGAKKLVSVLKDCRPTKVCTPLAPGTVRVLVYETHHHGCSLCFAQKQVWRQVHFVHLQLPPAGVWRAVQ